MQKHVTYDESYKLRKEGWTTSMCDQHFNCVIATKQEEEKQ